MPNTKRDSLAHLWVQVRVHFLPHRRRLAQLLVFRLVLEERLLRLVELVLDILHHAVLVRLLHPVGVHTETWVCQIHDRQAAVQSKLRPRCFELLFKRADTAFGLFEFGLIFLQAKRSSAIPGPQGKPGSYAHLSQRNFGLFAG